GVVSLERRLERRQDGGVSRHDAQLERGERIVDGVEPAELRRLLLGEVLRAPEARGDEARELEAGRGQRHCEGRERSARRWRVERGDHVERLPLSSRRSDVEGQEL